MKLRQEILDQVNNVECRRRISEKLAIGDQMLYLHMKANKSNGRLTKMDALTAIAGETLVPVTELLEPAEENSPANVGDE